MLKCTIKKSGIYIIKNYLNGKVYVGSSLNFSDRIKRHRADLKNNKHHSIKLQRAFNKYGIDSLEFIPIQYCAKDEILIYEQYWINYFDSYTNGYNSVPIAGNCFGYKQTDEHKRNISNGLKGFKRSEENKENMRLANVGKVISEETKDKIRKTLTGNKLSDETKNKLSKINKGKIHSEESKSKMRKPKSDDHGKNISNSKLGIKFSKQHILNLTKSRKARIRNAV
jgi:group I intron endonuclease